MSWFTWSEYDNISFLLAKNVNCYNCCFYHYIGKDDFLSLRKLFLDMWESEKISGDSHKTLITLEREINIKSYYCLIQ